MTREQAIDTISGWAYLEKSQMCASAEECASTDNELSEALEWIRPGEPQSIEQELMELLVRHSATIRSSCQTGCSLEVFVGGKVVKEFCCSIPESTPR